MQRIDYDTGGSIISYFPLVIDGSARNINGVVPSQTGPPFDHFDFRSVWFPSLASECRDGV